MFRSQCDKIFDRNFWARSLRGLPKKSVFSASSTISPLSMKMTRCATLLAKPISWVMTMMVVTHEMGFASKVAHRVIFMDNGEIVEDALKTDFFGSPRSDRAQKFLSKILSH